MDNINISDASVEEIESQLREEYTKPDIIKQVAYNIWLESGRKEGEEELNWRIANLIQKSVAHVDAKWLKLMQKYEKLSTKKSNV